MSRVLSPRTTLESLKKEARKWLKQIQSDDLGAVHRFRQALPNAPVSPTLRDVQLALAREYSAPGWLSLTKSLTYPLLIRYDEMADALLDAYNTGTPQAMKRHYDFTFHQREWDSMRRYVRLDLGLTEAETPEYQPISLEDARRAIAREHGYATWQHLMSTAIRSATARDTLCLKPMQITFSDTDLKPTQLRSERSWATISSALSRGVAVVLNSEGQMTDELLANIASNNRISRLDLCGSRAVSDKGIQCLLSFEHLTELNLSGTSITDRAMTTIAQLANLHTLNLGWTSITDAGLKHLSDVASLERIELMGTQTGDGTMSALAELPNLCHLKSGTQVTNAGLRELRRYPCFKQWQDRPASMNLLGFDAEPTYLLIDGELDDESLAHLRGLDGLFALNIGSSKHRFSSKGVSGLYGLKNLGWLSLDVKQDNMMEAIASLPKLQFLMCQDTVCGDDGFAALSKSLTLEYLWGRRCYNLQDRGFAALASLPKLRSLSVSCKNVRNVGLAKLPEFPSLRELMPMDVEDDGYQFISKCSELESLLLMYSRSVTDRSTEYIEQLPKLKKYFVSYTQITDKTPELLSTMHSLEDVEFSSCSNITTAGIDTLSALPNLKRISVNGCPQVAASAADQFLNVSEVRITD